MGSICCIHSISTNSPSKSSSEPSALSPGVFTRLNSSSIQSRYELSSEVLGSGGFGTIKLCTHKKSLKKRVLKVIPKSEKLRQQSFEIETEISICKTLNHPNIVRAFDFYEEEEQFLIVMEHIEGEDLFTKIKREKTLPEEKTGPLFLQIVSGVMHMHINGIIHRDLKPENIMLFKNTVKIIDFESAVYMSKKMNRCFGSFPYLAPECFNSKYSFKSDVWSLGVILYLMLSGTLPFTGETSKQLEIRIKNHSVYFNPKYWRHISKDVKKLVTNMLEKQPGKRITIHEVFEHPWVDSFKCTGNLPVYPSMPKIPQMLSLLIISQIANDELILPLVPFFIRQAEVNYSEFLLCSIPKQDLFTHKYIQIALALLEDYQEIFLQTLRAYLTNDYVSEYLDTSL